EIYNKSSKIFNLNNWKLGDNSTYGTIQASWLMPGEYKVLCPTAAVSLFPNAVGVNNFPSLNNSSDDIKIVNSLGIELDKISYNMAWYHDASKQDGGWSIERINPDAPCNDLSNWKAS